MSKQIKTILDNFDFSKTPDNKTKVALEELLQEAEFLAFNYPNEFTSAEVSGWRAEGYLDTDDNTLMLCLRYSLEDYTCIEVLE